MVHSRFELFGLLMVVAAAADSAVNITDNCNAFLLIQICHLLSAMACRQQNFASSKHPVLSCKHLCMMLHLTFSAMQLFLPRLHCF